MTVGTFGDNQGQGVLITGISAEIRIYTKDTDEAHELAEILENIEDIVIRDFLK